jgi:DNA-binding XRE family transcriptional regulator
MPAVRRKPGDRVAPRPRRAAPAGRGFVALDAIVDELESTPAGRRQLASARRWVGRRVHAGEPATLAAFRLARGLSQKQLAERLGTSQSYVARLEAGQIDPQFSTVRRVCAELGIDLAHFAKALDARR